MCLKLFLKHGEKVQMWLNKLKIAITNQDTNSIDELLNDMPQFSELSKMQEAMYLLKEAVSLSKKLQDETLYSMKQIKKNIKFIKSTQLDKISSLDITS